MHDIDRNKVVFHSKEDIIGGHYLQKGEHILRDETKSNYTDINEVLELYNLKQYIDNNLYLKSWTQDDIANFKIKANEYGKAVGQFMATINDNNITSLYEKTLHNYVHSFWELVNNQSVFKRISKTNFNNILTNEPHLIHEIIIHKNLIDYYDQEIKNFLLIDSQSAEILLSIYESQDNSPKRQKFIPKSLTVHDKENIILNYLDSDSTNLNYIELIQNSRNTNDFKLSDRTRLKAKRLHNNETEKIFADKSGMEYGVSVNFLENTTKIKDDFIDDNSVINYTYSLDFIKQNNNTY